MGARSGDGRSRVEVKEDPERGDGDHRGDWAVDRMSKGVARS